MSRAAECDPLLVADSKDKSPSRPHIDTPPPDGRGRLDAAAQVHRSQLWWVDSGVVQVIGVKDAPAVTLEKHVVHHHRGLPRRSGKRLLPTDGPGMAVDAHQPALVGGHDDDVPVEGGRRPDP